MSQTMILHWSPRSPYVRKVMIAIWEMGLQDRVRTVRTVAGGTTPHRELMLLNPVGKIPTLELPDGTAIYDSPVILEYLDTLHDGPKLYPTAWPERLTALRRHALGQGMLDCALPLLGEGFRPPEQQSEPHKALWAGEAGGLRGGVGAGGRGARDQRVHRRASDDWGGAGLPGFPLCFTGVAGRSSNACRVARDIQREAFGGGKYAGGRSVALPGDVLVVGRQAWCDRLSCPNGDHA